MAKLFAFDRPIESDQLTGPTTSSTELKNAMALVYNHVHRHRKASRAELIDALDKMAETANNENWVIYVP